MDKFLGQVLPADTNIAVLYSPKLGKKALVKNIIICNTHAVSATTYTIFYNPRDGGTVDASTIFKNVALATLTTVVISDINLPFDAGQGVLAVQVGVASTACFTAVGEEI